MQAIPLSASIKHVHFIGVGGISMSALAEILLRNGFIVSGSDDSATEITAHLSRQGIAVAIGNRAENITNTMDLVVYTAAVKPDNPEYIAASGKGIPLMTRAALLGLIMQSYPYTLCVAGTHGKTTTTSLLADTLTAAGLDPTVTLGGHMGDGFNYKIGQSPYFVMEACEYAKQFLQWKPYVGVILNIDNDHMDVYGDMAHLIESFAQFARNIKPEGALVIQAGVPGFKQIISGLKCRVITFGGVSADYTAASISYNQEGRQTFDLMHRGKLLLSVAMRLSGAHNIQNALACAAVTLSLGVDTRAVSQGLLAAQGARRRYERKGVFNEAEVVDDYAHHPTEIRAILSAIRTDRKGRSQQGRIVCLFQPHTYTRTKNLLSETAQSFGDADVILLLPIFASREQYDPSIGSHHIARQIKQQGGNATCFDDFAEAEAFLRQHLIPGDVLVTMGAGDVYKVGEALLCT